jgi:hypothetical protein
MSVKIDGTSGIDAVKSSALTDKLGRRNYLINGNFDKWDYATSQTSNMYGSDNRWMNGNYGSTKTHSQVACGDTERALFNAMYFSRTQVSSVTGAGNYALKAQSIENVNLLAGKTVTLSFWAKADANKNIAIEILQGYGTGGSPSAGSVGAASQLIALTTTWQKKTITVTLAPIVGKTLGTDGVQTTYNLISFWFDAGSNFNARTANLGQQSGTFDIAQVKIEDGSVATNGWHPYDGEFGGDDSACERYLPKITNNTYGIVGQAIDANTVKCACKFRVRPRVAPTGIIIPSGNGIAQVINASGTGLNTTSVATVMFLSIDAAVLTAVVSGGGLTAGNAVLCNVTAPILFTGCEL